MQTVLSSLTPLNLSTPIFFIIFFSIFMSSTNILIMISIQLKLAINALWMSNNLNQDLKDEIEELNARLSKLQIYYDD